MSNRVVPSGEGHLAIPLDSLHSKLLDSIQIYQTQEVLTLDLRFEDGLALELLFSLGFKGFSEHAAVCQRRCGGGTEAEPEVGQVTTGSAASTKTY